VNRLITIQNCITFSNVIGQFVSSLRFTVLRFCMCHGLNMG